MYTRTQRELTDIQKHTASQSTILLAFGNRNLKSDFSYLFTIMSSHNFTVSFLPFSIAKYTLPNQQAGKLNKASQSHKTNISQDNVFYFYTKSDVARVIACGWQMENECMDILFQRVACRLLVAYIRKAVPAYVQARNMTYAARSMQL